MARTARSPRGPESQEEHYFPPPPPPLPKLDPLSKGAWAALFGGPAYLLIATAVGWTVPAVAAFFAIGAFVGGFAILVLRMGDDPQRLRPRRRRGRLGAWRGGERAGAKRGGVPAGEVGGADDARRRRPVQPA